MNLRRCLSHRDSFRLPTAFTSTFFTSSSFGRPFAFSFSRPSSAPGSSDCASSSSSSYPLHPSPTATLCLQRVDTTPELVPTAITSLGYASVSTPTPTETATASSGSGNLKLCVTLKDTGSITFTPPSRPADSTRCTPYVVEW